MNARPYCIDVADPAAWMRHLDDEGYVVVTNAFSDVECQRAVELFVAHYGVGAQLYTDEYWPAGSKGMILKGDFHRSELAMWARTHPNVLATFRRIYGDDTELVTSFDRGNAVRNVPSPEEGQWTHLDWPVNDPAPFRCVQGFVNFVDCTASDSPCLRVWPRSHKGPRWDSTVATLKERNRSKDSAFFRVKVDPEELVNVLAPAGSIVLFCGVHDARTHITRAKPGMGPLRRLTVYTCLAPRMFTRGDAEAQARTEAFERGIVSTHWPVHFFRHHTASVHDSRYNVPKWDAEAARAAWPEYAKLV